MNQPHRRAGKRVANVHTASIRACTLSTTIMAMVHVNQSLLPTPIAYAETPLHIYKRPDVLHAAVHFA